MKNERGFKIFIITAWCLITILHGWVYGWLAGILMAIASFMIIISIFMIYNLKRENNRLRKLNSEKKEKNDN